MIIQPVVSENWTMVGYDPENKQLEITLTQGDVYRYFDVPEPAWQGLIAASSKEKFHQQFIRHTYYGRRVS